MLVLSPWETSFVLTAAAIYLVGVGGLAHEWIEGKLPFDAPPPKLLVTTLILFWPLSLALGISILAKRYVDAEAERKRNSGDPPP